MRLAAERQFHRICEGEVACAAIRRVVPQIDPIEDVLDDARLLVGGLLDKESVVADMLWPLLGGTFILSVSGISLVGSRLVFFLERVLETDWRKRKRSSVF